MTFNKNGLFFWELILLGERIQQIHTKSTAELVKKKKEVGTSLCVCVCATEKRMKMRHFEQNQKSISNNDKTLSLGQKSSAHRIRNFKVGLFLVESEYVANEIL